MSNEINIKMKDRFGSFLSNGSLASMLSMNEIYPNIQAGSTIVIDMSGVENMTDSFGNALIANMVKTDKNMFLERVKFANCSDTMKTLIKIAIKFGDILGAENK